VDKQLLDWLQAQQPTVDALIYRAANSYYRHQRDVVGLANLDYDIGVTIHEALNLSSGLDLCYDRPTIGFTYSLWYHARRVNTFLRYFLRELATTSAASLDIFGLGYLTADDYLSQPRTGRGAKISHRPLVWQCFERYFEQLAHGQSFTNRRLTFLRGLRDGSIQHKFDHIFVDEYQDCTPADLEIFRHLLHDPDCIVLAGDLAQAVQIGRTSAAEKRFRHFMGLKQDRRNLRLQGSYRLPFRISEAIREVSEQINTLYKGDRDAGVIAPYKGSPPGARPVLVYGESVAQLAGKVSEILRAYAPFALREVTILEKDVALASCLQPQVAVEVETDTILKLKGLEKTCIIWSTATNIEHRGEVFEFIYTILTRTSCLLLITLTPATQELYVPLLQALRLDRLICWDAESLLQFRQLKARVATALPEEIEVED
jgi:DNA helicase II / ATP-dependent DNA helicase PcrA